MEAVPFVPGSFEVPSGLRAGQFVLEPLAVSHNESDFAAWTSSVEHIRATPGYPDGRWPPRTYTLDENAADLRRHARDFAERKGFTYTVLDPANGEVIGCVYVYPPCRDGYDADVRSWVRADRADLDRPLYELVSRWLAEAWPFTRPDYAAR